MIWTALADDEAREVKEVRGGSGGGTRFGRPRRDVTVAIVGPAGKGCLRWARWKGRLMAGEQRSYETYQAAHHANDPPSRSRRSVDAGCGRGDPHRQARRDFVTGESQRRRLGSPPRLPGNKCADRPCPAYDRSRIGVNGWQDRGKDRGAKTGRYGSSAMTNQSAGHPRRFGANPQGLPSPGNVGVKWSAEAGITHEPAADDVGG